MLQTPTLDLLSGSSMPRIGLGTWPMDDSEAERSVAKALELGYRMVDTASAYGNETGVGKGVVASKVERSDVFVTTKLDGQDHGANKTRDALVASLKRLDLEYLDLFLIHWPLPEKDLYAESWQAMIDARKDGLVRAIGVSNFRGHHIDRLINETGVTPDVNQIQLHPAIAQAAMRKYDAQHRIVTQSWSPLGMGANQAVFSAARSKLDDPVITELAERHGKNPGQIVLRWHVQLGLVPVPKSSNKERMIENLEVFDFSLSDADMEQVTSLDQGEEAAVDPDA